jgi:hypothetical protein
MLEKERGQDKGGILAYVHLVHFSSSFLFILLNRDDMGLGKD